MTTYNLYSPDPQDYLVGPVHVLRLKGKFQKNLTPENLKKAYRYAKGSFTFTRVRNSDKQNYNLNIVDGWDALIVAQLFTNVNAIDQNKLPAGYKQIYRTIKHLGGVTDNFINMFKSDLDPYFRVKVQNNKVVNPKTGRKIQYAPNKPNSTYKKIFKTIKLKNVIDNNLTLFNTIDYKIDKWCVPSYLESFLSKKQYQLIRKKLIRIKTPTYPQLTRLLNSINYGLEVRTIENEILQEQKDFKKKLKILIHNEHMYVLTNTKQLKNHKLEELDEKEFDDKFKDLKHKLSYNEFTLYDDEKKYIKKNTISENIRNDYQLFNSYNLNNVDFYENVNIRPPKYYDCNIENVTTLDINKCYKTILNTEDYFFSIQNGQEITKKYSGTILNHGFYFCEFKKMNKTQKILFPPKTWLHGDTIKILRLKSNLIITLEHIPYTYMKGKKTDYEGSDISVFTGTLGQIHKPTILKKYDISDELEKEAILDKYKLDSYLTNKSNTVCIDKTAYKRNSGLYAYLSIWSYNRLQIYFLINEVIKMYKNKVNFRKIYTDSLTFDQEMTETQFNKINENLKKYNFQVKFEESDYNFESDNTFDNTIEEYKNKNYNVYKKNDIIKLLEDNKSFGLYGKGGYGKTYTTKNIIIDHLEKHNKKYILSSTTKKNAEDIGGQTIQSILFNKEKSLYNLKKTFKEIDYLIIDEVSQITCYTLLMLQHLKRLTNVNYIFVGDQNQCGSVDNPESWINTPVLDDLIDYNKVILTWSKFSRYTKEYDDILNKIIEYEKKGLTKKKFNYYVSKLFKTQGRRETKDKNDKFLVYTHKKGLEIQKKKNKPYCTVHSAQGETIESKYSIYEWQKMPFKVLYTALSRGKDLKNVFLIV